MIRALLVLLVFMGVFDVGRTRASANRHTEGDSSRVNGDEPTYQITAGYATRYGCGAPCGDSVNFTGGIMACGQPYNPWDETIIAVGRADGARWQCGQQLTVCARTANAVDSELLAGGIAETDSEVQQMRCIVGSRVDSCGGCKAGHIDLSDYGLARLCGHWCDRLNVWIIEPLP